MDSSLSSERQQQTIDRLDQELRDVRLELEAQQRETEFLRQQLALLRASQAASQQFRSSHTLNVEAEKCDPSLASLQDEEAIVSTKFADALKCATNKTVTDPVTISIVEANGEFDKTYDDICLRSVSMCSSVQCEDPCDAEDLKHRLAHAMNDSIIRGVNDDIISSCGSFRNHIPSLPVRDQVSNMLFPAASTKDLASSYSVLPISASSRCRSAGAPRSATSSAASDGMAQA